MALISPRALKAFASDRQLIIVFISQIDRSYDPATKPFPDLGDVRLPNPLDLTLFDKTYFLQGRNPFRVAGLADLNKKPGVISDARLQ